MRKNSMTDTAHATDTQRSGERKKTAQWKWWVIALVCLGLALCIWWTYDEIMLLLGAEPDQESSLPEIVLPEYPISITQDQTIQLETAVSNRYCVYRTETGAPMVYDAQEDRYLDLQEIILGDTSDVFDNLVETALKVAKEKYFDLYLYPVNQEYIKQYIVKTIQNRNGAAGESIKLVPDLSFMSQYEEYRNRGDKVGIFEDVFLGDIYQEALSKMDHQLSKEREYYLDIYGLDEVGGRLLIRTKPISSHPVSQLGEKFLLYDVQANTIQKFSQTEQNEVFDFVNDDGYSFLFSGDGSVITATTPSVSFSGGYILADITKRFGIEYERSVGSYNGEQMGVIFLEDQKTYTLPETDRAVSNLFISDHNKVLYYKVMDLSVEGKKFQASSEVWYNRLNLYNRDTDQWAFYLLNAERNPGKKVVLQGNIVRFAEEDNIVIMERNGAHYAYLLADGSDVTEAVMNGKIPVYPHEQVTVTHEEGYLYAKNLLSGDRKQIAQADTFVLSSDGAFVFAYCNGSDYVTCYDVASLKSRQIAADSGLCQKFAAAEVSVVKMQYHEEGNTLLLSFCEAGNASSDNDSGIDFYTMLKQLEQK